MVFLIRRLVKDFEIGFIEVAVGLLMIVGLIGYFWKVPADIEWIDHTISFTLFTLIFYKISITSIMFGNRKKIVDAVILCAYFIFFLKDIVLYTGALAEELNYLMFLQPAYSYITNHRLLTSSMPFFLASSVIILASIYAAFRVEIKSPSMIDAILPKKLRTIEISSHLKKFFIIFILLLSFYYFVYNTILEWLEFTFDDPIIFVGILFFLHKLHKHKEKFDKGNFVFKVADFSEGIYKRFIALFHYRKTILLGVSGIVILHMLSDLGVYIVYYATWLNNIYISFLGEGHTKIIELIMMDTANGKMAVTQIGVILVYAFNVIGIVSLLLLPTFLWISLFRQRELSINKWVISLIITSLFIYAIYPVFSINSIVSANFVGVDITTTSLFEMPHLLDALFKDSAAALVFTVISSFILFILLLVLSSQKKIKNSLFGAVILISSVFVGYYIFRILQSQFRYFLMNISYFVSTFQIFFALMFTIILLIIITFYITGYLVFIYETGREFHHKKWSKTVDKELRVVMKNIRVYGRRRHFEKHVQQ